MQTRTTTTALQRILVDEQISSVFQPIVDLESRAVVGYEALSRGPRDSSLESPQSLFAAARTEGLTRELEELCTRSAFRAADAAGLREPFRLFINMEPAAFGGGGACLPDGLVTGVPSVVEITERDLTAHPADLLTLVDQLRERGWGIALDDVGANPDSLALLPLLKPDVIKLDLRLVQCQPSAEIAAIVNAVSAESERAGALVLAEGIETPEHRQTALAMGATLGQGWLFGRPAPLPALLMSPEHQPIPIASLTSWPRISPYDIVAAARRTRCTDKGLLIEVTKHLEQQARAVGIATVVIASFQHRRYFTSATAMRYADIATSAALVAVLGEQMPLSPSSGVTGVDILGGDPLADEWDIVVLSPYFAGALVARDRLDGGPESRRRFDYVLTHDRDLVVRVAQSLMSRIRTDVSAS